ncbi:MAG: hypothetical protein PHW96_02895 [Candidatus Nanoarchaeia archaeon]|nr:hypothetical protein [Candidatus Nanoarchaeia archaeon]
MKRALFFAVLLLLSVSPILAEKISEVHIKIPGVRVTSDGSYQGLLADLYVEIHDGNGRTFVDTMPLTEVDTQAGARLARQVSCDLLADSADSVVDDCSKYDFFYIIRSEYSMIGGPSAGASMAVATMSAMLNKTINPYTVMTGTINPDGSIGPVGGILEKAYAVYLSGGKYFLIPKGQSKVYVPDTTTSQSFGWTFISSGVREVDIAGYAKANWGIDVVEISYSEYALPYFINYELVREDIGSIEFATEQYTQAMRKMADYLVFVAEGYVSVLRDASNSTELNQVYAVLAPQWLSAEETHLKEAVELYNKTQYYSAASKGVITASNSLYYFNLIQYEASSNKSKFVFDFISDVEKEIQDAENLIEKHVDSVYDIELLTVAYDRIKEAIDLIDRAKQYYMIRDYVNALGYSSLASIRKETSLIWASVTDDFTGNLDVVFEPSKMSSLALERFELAKSSVVYAELLTSGSFLNYASEGLSKAATALAKEEYVFALFEAIESRANANLAMELREATDEMIQERLSKKREDAIYAIHQAEKQGMLPILALSYLEYASEFSEDAPETALQFYAYSKEFAEIAKELSNALLGETSYSENTITINPTNIASFQYSNEIIVFSFLLGFAIGLAFVIIKVGL